MNRQQFRNRLLLIFALLVGLIVALCYSAWFTASAFGITIVLIAIFNYRRVLLMSKMGQALRAMMQRRYAEAEAALREALTMGERIELDDSCRSIVYQDLASVTRMLGNYTDAEHFGILALETLEKTCGADHPDTIFAREELARLYLDIARYAQAQPLLEKALKAHEAQEKAASFGSASCLKMLGDLWAEQEVLARAEPYLRQAFEMVRQLHAQFMPGGLAITMKLAHVCAKQGKIAEADALVEAGWEGIQKRIPPDPLLVALGLNQRAFVRHLQARYLEAEEVARQALALIGKFAEPNQPELAVHLNLLGAILSKQSKWEEAEEHSRKALRLREEYLAPEHPLLAESLENYACVLEQMGRFGEAQIYARRATRIRDFHAPLRVT
jgi:tetratricopeptide (TPR) repeat protein